MDMQGTPIGSTNQGMKNTTDPRSKIPKQEAAGPIASDSLAAESTRAGGEFSKNRDAAPLAVSGSSSTLNTTDTSAATTLAPAPDAQEREAKAAWQETSDSIKGPGRVKYDEGAGGQEDFPGAHSEHGYYGGPTGAKASSGGSSDLTGSKSSSGSSADTTRAKASSDSSADTKPSSGSFADATSAKSSSGSTADAAPSYISSVVSEPTKSGKPHGKNITEGGFDSDPSKNASFNSDIGDKNDPGRVAENQFQRQTLESGLDAAPSAPRQKEVTNDGQYDVLETEQSL